MPGLDLYQQEIGAAAEVAVRKYKEVTPVEEIKPEAITATMKTAIRDATEHSKKKLSKIVLVANPALGEEWLQELRRSIPSLQGIHCDSMCMCCVTYYILLF